MNRMYKENAKSINAHVGCEFECVYCKPSFQRLMKRQKCSLCRSYTPHFHPKRLLKSPPHTVDGQFIFFPSCGDPFWATNLDFKDLIHYTEKWQDRTFLIQSKDPSFFNRYKFPSNVILGTTLETNRSGWLNNPSNYKEYWQVSRAPLPYIRAIDMVQVQHKRKAVTIEPILSFQQGVLVAYIEAIEPEFVYVGYDNHNCKLPEPSLAKTQRLISDLQARTEVRVKTLRKAWWENERVVGDETP